MGFAKIWRSKISSSLFTGIFHQLYNTCIKLGSCFSGMIKARVSGSKVPFDTSQSLNQLPYKI